MNRFSAALAGLLFFAVVGSYAASQQPAVPGKGILSVLRAGQAVELGEYHGNTFIRIYEDDELKAAMKDKIKEIHEDYIVIASPANPNMEKWGSTEQYLPLHAVHSIVVVKKKDGK